MAFGLPILSGILKIKEKGEIFAKKEQNGSDSEESEFEIDETEIDEKGMFSSIRGILRDVTDD